MDVERLQGGVQLVRQFGRPSYDAVVRGAKVTERGQTDGVMDLAVVARFGGEQREQIRHALVVADVVELRCVRFPQDVVDDGGQIDRADLVEAS